MDIDADHHADVPLPSVKSSASSGEHLNQAISEQFLSPIFYKSHTPADGFKALKSETGLSGLPDQDRWNLVTLAWSKNILPHALGDGRKLYEANCAACHGEQGKGDGVFAAQLSKPASLEPAGVWEHTGQMLTGEVTQKPADFSDADRMLAASPALLQGKILLGGMGTGMPSWGPIFSDQQT